MAEYVSNYVLLSEFECSHCRKLPPGLDLSHPFYSELFDSFSILRAEWGKPINITSGYRCPEHNFDVGGSLLSAHLWGALDCDLLPSEVVNFADMVNDLTPDLRMGVYTVAGSFVHIDTGYIISPRVSASHRRGKRWTG